MDDSDNFRLLLTKTILAVTSGAAIVTLCYAFVDRPVASFVHRSDFSKQPIWKQLTLPPPILQAWAPVAIASLAVRRAFGRLARWELVVFSASVALVIADQFRESLAFVFGRYWPETWIDDNPSWTRDGAYGFHFLMSGSAYGSFPSGHCARMAAMTGALWVASWRWGAAGLLATFVTAAGLLAMNYHFVSDIIAGTLVGALVGVYASQLCGLRSSIRPAKGTGRTK